jgi:hypothetical protein
MFALFALAVLSEAGERLFLQSVRYGQPVQSAVASPQVMYYADASGSPVEAIYYANAAVPQGRAVMPVMSAVTERDADGNPVTHTEMFDFGWVAITLLFYVAVLAKIALG